MKILASMLKVYILMSIMFVAGHYYGGNIFNERLYKLHGQINPVMSEKFREWITKLGKGDSATVRIETYGGHLSSGFKIGHYLKTTKADITCVVDSHAMSAGALILQNCKRVRITDTATILYHLPRYTDNSSPLGYRLISKENLLYKMFMKEVDSQKLLTEQERKAMVEGKDIYIDGKTFMMRFYTR